MKILFDQGTPAPLRLALAEHVVVTAAELGWERLTDRELLDRSEAEGFDVLVTTDQNLQHQQVLADRRIAVLVLRTTDWRLIQRQVEMVSRAVTGLEPGAYIELAFSKLR